MRKKVLSGSLAIILIVSLSFIIAANSNQNYVSKTGNETQTIESNNILAVVNGKKISYQDFQAKKKVYDKACKLQEEKSKNDLRAGLSSKGPQKKTAEQYLQKMIRDQVICDDCAKKGITVSRKEAKQALEKNYETIQELMKNGTGVQKEQAKATWDYYQSLIQSLGITLEQYTEQYGTESMQMILLENKHYENFAAGKSSKKLSHKELAAQYEKEVSRLVSQSNIQIHKNLLNDSQ